MTHKSKYRFILFLFVILAVLLRLVMLRENLINNPQYFHNNPELIAQKINSPDQPYQNRFGSEISNVAYALVCGDGSFSNPFGDNTGPTGWVAPGITALYVCSFILWGCFTYPSILFLYLLSLLLTCMIIVLIYYLAQTVFEDNFTAYISSFLYVISPHDILLFAKPGQQDFNVFPFYFILILFFLILYLKQKRRTYLVIFSLSAAAAVLSNPVFIFPATICMLYIIVHLFRTRSAKKHADPILATGLIVCCILPYVIYQKNHLNKWAFIKSNGLYEIYQGNAPASQGILTLEVFKKYHPMANVEEFRKYKHEGEIDYIENKWDKFKEHFELKRFLDLSVNRILHFFFIFPSLGEGSLLHTVFYAPRGLALVVYVLLRNRQINSLDLLLLLYILAYAFPYFLTGIMYRYSFPIVPVSFILLGRSIVLFYKKAISEKNSCHA